MKTGENSSALRDLRVPFALREEIAQQQQQRELPISS